MSSIHDEVLGEVLVKRMRTAKNIRVRYLASGKFSASVPTLTPLFYVKKILRESRQELLEMKQGGHMTTYSEGQVIGKRHRLAVVNSGMTKSPKIQTLRETLVVTLPHDVSLSDSRVQALIREEAKKILRLEAKHYLPVRLKELAAKGPFDYERLRFSHANGRWGSCSSTGTISLNIALMKLPDILIDYVIVHELAHTVHMNHSKEFWQLVSEHDPLYKSHRRLLKLQTPHI